MKRGSKENRCRGCKFYKEETDECDMGIGFPKIGNPNFWFKSCPYWNKSRKRQGEGKENEP